MQKPLVSVVIPAYRCASTISKAIDSALAQGVALEVIVVNDGNKEELDSVIASYAQEEAVIFLHNDINRGAAYSRNRGVCHARGAYIAFLDADDYWAADKLAKQLKALDESGAALCCTARELLTPDGQPTGKVIGVKSRITYRELLKHNSINCSSVLMPAQIAKTHPMHDDDCHEDYILWLEILKQQGVAVGINEPLLKYRLSTSGKSGNKLHSARMTYQVYRRIGNGRIVSSLLFCRYAFHGVLKYTFTRRQNET